MLEYIGFGALVGALVLVFLVYQKISNKNQPDDNNQLSLATIQERLGIIETAQKILKL
jgi:hypothetical protein